MLDKVSQITPLLLMGQCYGIIAWKEGEPKSNCKVHTCTYMTHIAIGLHMYVCGIIVKVLDRKSYSVINRHIVCT